MSLARVLPAAVALAFGAALLSPLASTAAAEPASTTARAGAWTVKASLKEKQVVRGKTAVIKGSVKPRSDARGRQVVLQKRYPDGKRWVVQDRTKVRRDGTYTFKDKITSKMNRTYRVVMPAGAGHAKGVSRKLAVTVFSWRDLYTMVAVQGSTLDHASRVTMNGTEYPSSLRAWETGVAEYTLARKCLTLRATYGVVDDAPTGSQVQWDVSADEAGLYTGTFALGEATKIKLSMKKVFRVKLEMTGLNDLVDDLGGVGTPQVLCRD